MLRSLSFVPVILALSFTPASAPAVGGGAVLAMQKQLFAAIDRGDADAARAFVAADRKGAGGATSVFLLDTAGNAIRAGDAEASRKVLAHLAADTKSANGRFETKITFESVDCPSGELSFAILELDRIHEVDGRKETRSYRSTALVRHEESGWKLVHWHVSAAPKSE